MRLAGLIMMALFGLACSTGPSKTQKSTGRPFPKTLMKSPSIAKIAEPLLPAGRPFNVHAAAIIKHVVPGGLADRHGLKVGDRILRVDGESVESIAEFERKIKRSRGTVQVLYARGEQRRNATVNMPAGRPFGVEFAPFGVQLIRSTSPLVSFYKSGPFTVYAQGSYDDKHRRYRFNFIIESTQTLKGPTVKTAVTVKGQKSILASSTDTIDALGPSPVVISKFVDSGDRPNAPLNVSLAVNGSKFRFEFQ